jgi:hypothetical protein
MISSITKLTHLEEHLISPHLDLAHINQIQLMLPHLPYDEVTIGVFLKG